MLQSRAKYRILMMTLNSFKKAQLDAGRLKAEQNKKERKEQGLSAFKNPIERAKEHPDSLRKAITAKCYECVGMDGDANFRQTIRECTSCNCPLYHVRPYQQK